MNRNFEIIDDEVIVLTDNKGKITRKVQDNIEEILITENNIEEMEKLIEDEKTKIYRSKKEIKNSKYKFFLGMLWFINFTLNILIGNWFPAGCHFLCSSLWTFNYLSTVLPEKKHIKASEKNISVLEENLIIENDKLNELNKNKSNDSMCIVPEKKSIAKSEQIIKLKNKLDTIYMYTIHKNKIINYYKKGILKEKLEKYYWIDKDNFNLIEELIKNDISNEMNNVTNKLNSTKVHTLKKF